MTGRRTLEAGDSDLITRALAAYNPETDTFITGGAPGFDTEFRRQALQLGFSVEVIHADWEKHGRAAGPIRNSQMLDRRPDHLLAFPGGRGTANCIRQAEKRGIPVRFAVDMDVGPR